jgi:hypothetical protein
LIWFFRIKYFLVTYLWTVLDEKEIFEIKFAIFAIFYIKNFKRHSKIVTMTLTKIAILGLEILWNLKYCNHSCDSQTILKKLTNFCFVFLKFSKKTDNYNTIFYSQKQKNILNLFLRTLYKNKKSFHKFEKKVFIIISKKKKQNQSKFVEFCFLNSKHLAQFSFIKDILKKSYFCTSL